MRFLEDESHVDLRRSLRAFLADHSPMDRVRAIADGPDDHDRDLWRRLCQDFQVAGLCLPEQYGGQGAPWSFQAVTLEELGRTLTPSPLMSTVVLAATTLLGSGDDQACADWLPAIAAGEVTATTAAMEGSHDWDLERVATTAIRDEGHWRITGAKPWVTDGATADLAVVLAVTDAGPGLFVVDLTDPTILRERSATLDTTRPMAHLTFDGTPGRSLGRPGRGTEVLSATHRLAAVALATEQLGGAIRALEMAVDHARQRVQFGRPIGSFQSLKHLLADQLVDNEALTAAVRHASVAVDQLPEELELLAHLCQAVASEVYADAAGNNIQVHGGIGYTWEHDAHLYFKRATASRQWLGTSDYHREKVATLMLDAEPAPKEERAWNR